MENLKKIYEGKAKTLFEGPQENEIFLYFKDDTTAFNGEKLEKIKEKGRVNLEISRYIFKYLEKNGIPTHFLKPVDERTILVKKVKIIPLEYIVRNVVAGSLAKRTGLEEGAILNSIVVEYSYKNDDLGDPMFNEYHIKAMDLCSEEDLHKTTEYALKINELLVNLFEKLNLVLVDFKVEFGIDPEGNIVLADEISPDSCRLWEKGTGKKMDKDVFRRDLGDMMEVYKEVLKRIKEELI